MRDEWFIRGETPMTKSEVRAVSLSKLELQPASVLLDIGAGTGSVSVEAALCHPVSQIYAFEKKEDALSLLKQNRQKAGAAGEKITIIPGSAPDSFPETFGEPVTHAFIGGSSGNMERLLERLLDINAQMRIVINAIALESVAELLLLLKKRHIEAEIISVQVARSRAAGTYHLMQGLNPIYVVTFGGPDE